MNDFTKIAGIPSGGGQAANPKPERGEAKKPEPAPAIDWQLGIQTMSDYFKEQPDTPALNNPHPLGEEKFLAWGWDAAKKVAEQTFRKEQQEACLDWPALNYCDSCETCSGCLKHGACLGGE